jgi:hypothetical protein
MRRELPIPRRLLLPPAPTGGHGESWADLGFEEQRRLAARLDGDHPNAGAAAGSMPAADEDLLLRALARRRLDTLWRLRAGSVVLGWLVLMTVWGYGRASTGQTVSGWLWLGLAGGVVAAGFRARTTSHRARRWRRLADGAGIDSRT